ncbi:UNVERIFIED_CONTAM: Serine carboxypeptidase 1 [Sesamum angustifolium]|uniref:Serine carboxypeptidase 1 n=1 Tax=Sesamum angustifolium TaxID=2727405 RepID=A0AAW2QPW9_9LAMI
MKFNTHSPVLLLLHTHLNSNCIELQANFISASRYVTLDESHGKKLYYYFVESEGNPSKDPVVLWLNGGPGCSSFDGFVYEHGPFNFEAGKPHGSLPTLHLNAYSWSKVSSIIYLDSPAGVGLSYSGNVSDYETGDLKTATDTHTFLLKGYMVGNGVTDDHYDGNALVPFAHGMGLISDELYETVIAECQGNFYNPTSESCEDKLAKVDELLKDINIYDILEPCYHETPSRIQLNTRVPPSFRRLGETERPLPVRKRMFGRAWPFRAPVRDGYVPTWPQILNSEEVPCTDDEVANAWLNNETVRKAIHAESASVAGNWELCTDRITFYHDAGSMIKYHKNLTTRGIEPIIQVVGDHDMCVPYTGSQAWTRSVGYKTIDEWRPWYVKEQVAGYVQGYDNNLSFLTVKGSGHTVPEYKPVEALAFYSRWLAGQKI